MGGPVFPGRSVVVGEVGPELFVPNTAGAIIPNDVLRSIGGRGGGPTVIFQAGAIDARGADAGVEAKIFRAVEAGVKAAVKISDIRMQEAFLRG